MKKLIEIKISRLQLDVLLNKEEKEGFGYLLKHGVYCTRCNAICTKGVVNYTVQLNRLVSTLSREFHQLQAKVLLTTN